MTDFTSKFTARSNGGFAGKVAAESLLVYDLRVNLAGDDRYFIIKIDPPRHAAFLRALREDAGFTLEDYGDILHQGTGEPSVDLKRKLRTKYGLYEDEV